MAFTADEMVIIREMARARIAQGDDAAIDQALSNIRNLTEDELRVNIKAFAAAQAAENQAVINDRTLRKAFYDGVVAYDPTKVV